MKEKTKNQGTLHCNVIYAYSEPSGCFLTVSVAPITHLDKYISYLNLSHEMALPQKSPYFSVLPSAQLQRLKIITFFSLEPRKMLNLEVYKLRELMAKQTFEAKQMHCHINENGMIKAGDLITTSNKKGYGMKCKKPIDCIGAIAGISLENQDEKEDKIMVMVK